MSDVAAVIAVLFLAGFYYSSKTEPSVPVVAPVHIPVPVTMPQSLPIGNTSNLQQPVPEPPYSCKQDKNLFNLRTENYFLDNKSFNWGLDDE